MPESNTPLSAFSEGEGDGRMRLFELCLHFDKKFALFIIDQCFLRAIMIGLALFAASVICIRYSSGEVSSNGDIFVEELWIYPVKSCKGIRVQESELTPTGLRHDRIMMVVKADSGRFVSQRSHPKMAIIETAIVKADTTECIVLSVPGKMPVPLTLPLDESPSSTSDLRKVTIWDDQCDAVDLGDSAAAWISTFLQSDDKSNGDGYQKKRNSPWPFRLVRKSSASIRATDSKYAPSGPGQAAFADGFPYLLTSTASLADLNARLAVADVSDGQVDMLHFRPNIVVSGQLQPWAEDAWARIEEAGEPSNVTVGRMVLDVVKPCSRCTMPNVDHKRGVMREDKQPSKEMKSFRAGKHLGYDKAHPKWSGQLFFGQNLIQKGNGGKIRQGQSLVASSQ
jgi:uncharacterized protein YcbX